MTPSDDLHPELSVRAVRIHRLDVSRVQLIADVFDLLLSDNLSSPTIIDFNPYRPSTDSLLFTYAELHSILLGALEPLPTALANGANGDDSQAGDHRPRPRLPILKVVDSPTHPEANRGAPAFGTNMMPLEMVEMSQGRSLEEFREVWDEVVAAGLRDST